MAHANVAAHLPDLAEVQPDRLAVAVAGRDGSFQQLSCHELNTLCDRYARALVASGIGPGSRCVLMVRPSPAFFALTFALFKIGAVPVMVDPGMGLRNLGQCLREAEPEAFIGIAAAHWARRILRWPRGRIRLLVGPGLRLGLPQLDALAAAQTDEPFPCLDPDPGDTAAILFTSGSTGVPKGVVYSHRTFSSQVSLLRDVYGIAAGEVDLSTFPLFALFGPALGMASVVPRMDASRPARARAADLCAAVAEFGCTNMFANPALVDKLGRHCAAQGTVLHSLRRVISAGAPANNQALARLRPHLPAGTQVHTPYGATEALPVSSIGSDEILDQTAAATATGAGVCVGRPVPGIQLRILPIDDAPIANWSETEALAQGQLGEIAVAGPVVTESYFRRPAATAAAKLRDADQIWHRMGDLGYLDTQGRLWMCGRKGHRLRCAHGEMYTIPCEAVFNQHPQVFRSALVGIGTPGQERPVLCVELEAGATWTPELVLGLAELACSQDHTRPIDIFLPHPGFPVDVRHNAKIFREKLRVWATRQCR